MNKKTGIIIAVIAVVFLGLITWAQMSGGGSGVVDYNDYDLNGVIGATEDNGEIGDHVEGSEGAKVLFVEYSDFQCSGCAGVRNNVSALVAKYGGKVGVIHRTYVLSYHTNGVAAAAAAEAAGLQGYWAEYGEMLYANQSDWFYSDATKRTEQFEEYFVQVSEGKGDLEKFRADMNSDAVKKKVDFDRNSVEHFGEVSYTPAFYIDGDFIDWANNTDGKAPYVNADKKDFVEYMSGIVDAKLAEMGE